MPPKKAAETKPAAEKTADKPSPASAKKGADKPSPSSSSSSSSTTSTTHQPQHQQQHGGKSGGSSNKQISSDPVEAAIQNRLNEIEHEIDTHRKSLDEIKGGFDTTHAGRSNVIEQLTALRKKRNEKSDASKVSRDLINEKKTETQKMDAALKIKDDELKAIRDENKFYQSKDKTPEVYLADIDTKIKELETKQSSQSVSLKEEKNINSEIVTLKKQRLTYKTYYEKDQIYKKDKAALKELRDSINALREADQKAYEELTAVRKEYDELDASFKASKSALDNFSVERTTARDKIADLQKEMKDKKQELKDHRDKLRQEKKEEIQAERDERLRIRQEQEDKRREADEKRMEEELKQDAFSNEVGVIDQLIKYLTPFIPKAPKPAAPAAAGSPTTTTATATTGSPAAAPAKEAAGAKPAAGTSPAALRDNGPTGTVLVRDKEDDSIPLSKRNKKKKEKVEKDKEFKMNLQVVLQFESVSLTPPAKSSDIERSISQLREKKSFYQKKAVEERNKRLEDFKLKKAQRGQQAVIDAASAESATDASETPSSSSSDTTTSTSTTTTSTSTAAPTNEVEAS